MLTDCCISPDSCCIMPLGCYFLLVYFCNTSKLLFIPVDFRIMPVYFYITLTSCNILQLWLAVLSYWAAVLLQYI